MRRKQVAGGSVIGSEDGEKEFLIQIPKEKIKP